MMLTPFTYWQVIAMAQELMINFTMFFFSSLALFIILHGILYLVWELFSVIVPELKCQAWVMVPLYTSIICALSL